MGPPVNLYSIVRPTRISIISGIDRTAAVTFVESKHKYSSSGIMFSCVAGSTEIAMQLAPANKLLGILPRAYEGTATTETGSRWSIVVGNTTAEAVTCSMGDTKLFIAARSRSGDTPYALWLALPDMRAPLLEIELSPNLTWSELRQSKFGLGYGLMGRWLRELDSVTRDYDAQLIKGGIGCCLVAFERVYRSEFSRE